MKNCRLLIIGATLVVLVAGLNSGARAQSGGYFFLASDPGATSRVLTDETPGVCTVYIVHHGTQAGAEFLAVRFKVDNHGFTGVWLGDFSDYTLLGTSQAGVAVHFGGCLQPPILVLSVRYYCNGTSPCTTVGLAPDPLSDSHLIEAYDCSGSPLFPPYFLDLCVNGVLVPDDTGFGLCDCSVPAEDTTWGQIKAVYE